MPRKNISPDQGNLLVHDPYSHVDIPNPEMIAGSPASMSEPSTDYDPKKTDPNPGLSSPLAEGWGVMHDVITDIARERSNQGFKKLPVTSQPVRKFARRVAVPASEAQYLVEEVQGRKYDRAQYRLNGLRDKQIRRALGYNAFRKIVDNEVITDMVPMSIANVEHRYFYANSPAEAKAKERKRQTIARFVKKHRI